MSSTMSQDDGASSPLSPHSIVSPPPDRRGSGRPNDPVLRGNRFVRVCAITIATSHPLIVVVASFDRTFSQIALFLPKKHAKYNARRVVDWVMASVPHDSSFVTCHAQFWAARRQSTAIPPPVSRFRSRTVTDRTFCQPCLHLNTGILSSNFSYLSLRCFSRLLPSCPNPSTSFSMNQHPTDNYGMTDRHGLADSLGQRLASQRLR